MGIENSFFKPKIITEGGIENKSPLEQAMVSLSTRLSEVGGKEKIEGERDKTPEETELLKLARRCLEEELASLGLPAPIPRSEESFHFISSLSGTKLGTTNMNSRSAVVYPEKSPNTFDFAKVLIHESIHIQSHGAFIYRNGSLLDALDAATNEGNPTQEGSSLSPYRTGYCIRNEGREGIKDHDHFQAFNEGVVDKMALEITMKHAREIFDVYKDSSEKIREGADLNNYGQIYLVGDIIEGIAKETGKNSEEVWKTIKKGLFTGEMMPLRAIERVYGKGSLRVLDSSVADPKTKEEIKQNENVELYFWMFNSGKSAEEREKIKKEILGDSISDEVLEASIIVVEEQAKKDAEEENGSGTFLKK